MSSEQVQVIAMHPAVRYFTLKVLELVKGKKLAEYREKTIIDADLVPKLPRGKPSILKNELPVQKLSVLKPKLQNIETEIIPPFIIPKEEKKEEIQVKVPSIFLEKKESRNIIPSEIVLKKAAPVPKVLQPEVMFAPRTIPKKVTQEVAPQKVMFEINEKPKPIETKSISPKISLPVKTVRVKSVNNFGTEEFGQITSLISNPDVYFIECSGARQPIKVMVGGQKRLTQIILSEEEINIILENISKKLHLPLSEGVFRAAVDNFIINAVISKIIGSKFVIKKQVNYEMR